MDRYTYETRCWLELRFHPDTYRHYGRDYQPYQPLFGVEGTWTVENFLMASRLVRLLANLRALKPESFLDVGGAEGMVARLVRDELKIPTVSGDLAHQAALRAREFSEVPSLAFDAARLPFQDDSFDVVFLSEVLEHLANPVRTLLELRRVAKRAVIVTTEAFAPDEDARQEELDERELSAHMDRSIFCPHDFDLIFGDYERRMTNQCLALPERYPDTPDAAAKILTELVADDAMDWRSHGIIVVAQRGAPVPVPDAYHAEAARAVAECFRPRSRSAPAAPGPELPAELLARMQCPMSGETRFEFEAGSGSHASSLSAGDRSYAVTLGAPCVMADPDEPFAKSLESLASEAFGPGDERVAQVVELDRRLRFDLPEPHPSRSLFSSTTESWATEGEVEIAASEEGFDVESKGPDPQLLSPRLLLPMSRFGGFAVEIKAEPRDENSDEELQVFWHSLRRPTWWEGASTMIGYPADGEFHRLEFRPEAAAHLEAVADDELLRLRLDPLRGEGRATIRSFEILDARN